MAAPVPDSRRGRLKAVAGAVGARLVGLTLLGLLALLALDDVGSRLRRWTSLPSPSGAFEAVDPTDPGWPHRRGPAYDGVSGETELAPSWPAEGPPLLWTQPCGRGYSGITVVGGRLFTQTQSLTAQLVECLDAETGALVWQHRYGWPYEPGGMYPGPRATPTWHEGRVYFAAPDGLVGCLRASDGKPLWQTNVNERFGGRGTGFGYSCSPLIEAGKVILPVGGEGASVVALDARDGSTVWASGDEPASYCSALPITLQGRRCVVAFLQNVLAIFDLETGKPLGTKVCSRGYDEHAAEPLYREPLLMTASPFRAGAACYRLEAQEAVPAEEGPGSVLMTPVWSSRQLSNDTASSVLVDGRVYGFDLRDVQAKAHRPSRGTFRCLDFSSGAILWETDQVGHATVVAADEKLFLFTDSGELILVRAGSGRFEELGRTEVFHGEICWAAPALHRGRLYVRSPTRLACIYVGLPERLDADRRQAARPASLASPSGGLDLAWFAGGEREYAFDPADAQELRRWFLYCVVGVLGLAAACAAATGRLVAIRWPAAASRWGRAVFWTVAFILGILGTPIFNRWTGTFVFTWPVCLFVAHQVAVDTIVRGNRQSAERRRRWPPLVATCFLVAVCLAYYLACRRLSLASEWAFLLGFLPSWPLAVPMAHRLQREYYRPLGDLVWAVLAFSALFWSAGALLIWKAFTV